MMFTIQAIKKTAVAGVLLAGVIVGGGASAQAGWNLYSPDAGSGTSISTNRVKFSVRDAKADGYRAYGNYWRNDSNDDYQLVTKKYGEVLSANMSGSTRVSGMQACNDYPVMPDSCSKPKYV